MTKTTKLNIAIILLLAAIMGASYWLIQYRNQPKAIIEEPVLVELNTPTSSKIPNHIEATGSLQAMSVALNAKVPGYITQFNYIEGMHVDRGKLLLQLDDRKEKATFDAARAELNMSQLKYKQLSNMYHKHFASYDDYYTAKITAEKDASALETAKANLDDKRIYAPFAGTVGSQNHSIGDYISPGTTLLTVTNVKAMRVAYSVPAHHLSQIKINQPVNIYSEDLPDQVFHGHVSFIAPDVNSDTQTIELHADVHNDAAQLKPGMSVTVTQELSEPHNALVVPSSSLFATINGYYVLGVKQDKAVKLPVTIGRKFNSQVEILSGLNADSLFITAGQTKIQPGQAVTVSHKL